MNSFECPGLIDCHVHFREPGFTHKASMKSEARSAKAGGVFTVCEMPNTDPPCVTADALRQKIDIADGIIDCDIRFFFGITESAHIKELQKAWEDPDLRRRMCGVKLYLDHSTGNQKVDGGIVEEIFRVCAQRDIPLVAHCEDADINASAAALLRKQAKEKDIDIEADVSFHSLMRPAASEATAIAYAIALAEKHGTPFHIAHLSTAAGIDLVRQAKARGARVSCEVAPHHLFLTMDDYARLGTLCKMNPPLRSLQDRDALWEGVVDGTVDCIATDHAPHTLEEKQALPPLAAPSGVPGIETMLPLLLTVAAGGWPNPFSEKPDILVSGHTFKPSNIQTSCFTNPNAIFRLGIKESDHRLIIDPQAQWEIRGADMHGQCDWTPYEGWRVCGKNVQ